MERFVVHTAAVTAAEVWQHVMYKSVIFWVGSKDRVFCNLILYEEVCGALGSSNQNQWNQETYTS